MVGGANRYHDTKGDQPRQAGARAFDQGPVLPLGLRVTLLAMLALMWIGLLLETAYMFDEQVRDLGLQVAMTLKMHALFFLGVGLLWGASETRHISTGLRVGALVMGSVFVLHALGGNMLDMFFLGSLF